MFFLIVIDTLSAFQAFTQINVMTKGGPVNATNTLVYSIYREFYFNGAYGYAAAQSVILLFIMLAFTRSSSLAWRGGCTTNDDATCIRPLVLLKRLF